MRTLTHVFTTSATPDYSAGDSIGTPKEFPNFFDTISRSNAVHSITLKDKAGIGVAMNVYFFKTSALTGTYTDNAALVLSEQDFDRCVAVAKVATGDWATAGGRSIATVKPEIIAGNEGNDFTSLFVVVASGGAYNGASTSDVTIHINQE